MIEVGDLAVEPQVDAGDGGILEMLRSARGPERSLLDSGRTLSSASKGRARIRKSKDPPNAEEVVFRLSPSYASCN